MGVADMKCPAIVAFCLRPGVLGLGESCIFQRSLCNFVVAMFALGFDVQS